MNKLVHNVWFKCITVLLLISLISGGLLAVLNDVLAVSNEERTGRAIKKIYGEDKEYQAILDSDNGDEITVYDFGQVEEYFIVDETDKLVRATGYNGYKNGTITLWVKFIEEDGALKIDKVILQSYDKQTLMSKLDAKYYEKFTLKDVTDNYFTLDASDAEYGNPVSGATKSATAGMNAVNSAIKYLKENA